MERIYNIGTECYALLTSTNDVDFLLPIKIILIEKRTFTNKTYYKVRIKNILENDFNYIKEHLYGIRVYTKLSSDGRNTLIKKQKLDKISNMKELIDYIGCIDFYIEYNYITLDSIGLKNLYEKFTKYLINYHCKKLYQLMSRPYISTTPIFENQKDIFKRRLEKIGFGDMFDKFELNIHL